MKKALILMAVIAVLTSACAKEQQQQVSKEKLAIAVKVIAVGPGVFSRVLQYTGTVMPWKQAGIIPDVSGRVARILVKEGERVKQGELVASLDTTTLELQKKQAEAACAVAEAAMKDARINAERMRKLHARNAISNMQLEKTELALESAQTQKQNADANLNLVKHYLGSARMSAPFAGIITARHLDEGDMINPQMGAGPGVLTLMDLGKVKVRLDVAAEDIEKIKIGMPCKIRVNTLADRDFIGEVYSKTQAADMISKTFQVEIKVDNPGMLIKAGVFADVAIEVQREENVLVLPMAALIGDDQVVVFDNGRARLTRIKVGQSNSTRFEVLEGLKAGDEVVVEGNYDLKDGALIRRAGEEK